jgi:SAM-dependent methyltransferase
VIEMKKTKEEGCRRRDIQTPGIKRPLPERDRIELRKWNTIIESSPHEFHTFWWLKEVEMDYEMYFTYTNSIFPISLLNAKKGWSVLDIGCGWGRDVSILRKAYGANAIGIDIEIQNNDICADTRFLCFKDNSFDAAITISAFPYIKEKELVLGEVRRVLKHNGKFSLVLFNNSLSNLVRQTLKSSVAGVWASGRYGGHRKLYNAQEIILLLERSGFEVEVIYFTNFAVTFLNRLPKFYKIIFKYENKLSKMWIARWIAKRIVVIAKANKS